METRNNANTHKAQSTLIGCGAEEIARFLELISEKKNVVVNIYVQSIGNITDSTLYEVNTLKN